MLASPFAFYRGAALIFASDVAKSPRSGLEAQVCGDAHLSNFGIFGSPERELLFDVNDFDETLAGPWEWDVKRLAASLVIAARGRAFTAGDSKLIAASCARVYREAMQQFSQMRSMEIWYARADSSILERWVSQIRAGRRRRYEEVVGKAQTHDSLRAFAKMTTVTDGNRVFADQPPLLVPVQKLGTDLSGRAVKEALTTLLHRYKESLPDDRRHLLDSFEVMDIARKVVGVGSVGTRCWVVLLMGRDSDDPLLLQVKEAEASVLERYLRKSEYKNHGQRVVEGQRMMQAASDILLGWLRAEGFDGKVRDFYVRQLWDWKGSTDIELMSPKTLRLYGELCGWTLARAHARSGDPIAISAYLGKSDAFDVAIARFAQTYADQSERDFEALEKAAARGKIQAEKGV